MNTETFSLFCTLLAYLIFLGLIGLSIMRMFDDFLFGLLSLVVILIVFVCLFVRVESWGSNL